MPDPPMPKGTYDTAADKLPWWRHGAVHAEFCSLQRYMRDALEEVETQRAQLAASAADGSADSDMIQSLRRDLEAARAELMDREKRLSKIEGILEGMQIVQRRAERGW